MNLPFDPEEPPAEPPVGCDRLTWLLAYQLRTDHDLAPDGLCRSRTCRDAFAADWPCAPRRLAEAGLLGSWMGLDAI